MGRRARRDRNRPPARRRRSRWVGALLIGGIGLLGGAFYLGLELFDRPPPSDEEAPEPILDPGKLPFPANLPPEKSAKLAQAVQLHQDAIALWLRNDEAGGNAKGAAALRAYEEADALIPALSQLHHELVVRNYQGGYQRAAIELAKKWLERFPDSADHLETVGKAEYSAGNLTAAADHLARAAKLRPRSVGLQRRLAQVYSAAGRKEEGLRAAREALRLIRYPVEGYWNHRQAPETVRVAVATFHRFYEYAELLPVAEALLARFPNEPEALVASGVARRQLGDYAGAEARLRRVVDDPANGEEVRFELGIAILKQNRQREAAAVLAALLERNPSFSRAYFQLGQCLARLGRGGEAESLFRMSRALAPSEREFVRETELRGAGRPAEARRARAKALALRGQFREAEAALRSADLAGHPGLAIYLVEFLVDTLRGREAEAALQSAEKLLGAQHPDIRGWKARILALGGRAPEALQLFAPLAAAGIASTPWARDLGVLYLEDLADPRSAIPWLERARSDPPQIDELALLARAYLESGDPASAVRLLEPLSRAELRWDEEVRLPLALALLRSGPERKNRAAELIATAPEPLRATRAWHTARAAELTLGAGGAEREQAAHHAREAERLHELERRFRATQAEISRLSWPEAAEPLAAVARLRFEAGDRAGAIRLARLSAAANPAAAEPNRLLAAWLLDPAESFWRLEAVRRWLRVMPGDPEAKKMEEEVRKFFALWQ